MSGKEFDNPSGAVNEDVEQIENRCHVAERELLHDMRQSSNGLFPESRPEHVGAGNDSRECECQYTCDTIGAIPESIDLALPHDPITSWLVTTSSKDGGGQVLCFVYDSGGEDIRIHVESWTLKAITDGMQLQSEFNITVSKHDSLYTRFGAPHDQRLALIPKPSQTPLLYSVGLGLEGDLVHVGCRSYMIGESQGKQSYSLLDLQSAASSDSYFEESCRQGSIIVLARRRQLKSIEGDLPMSAPEHGARMRKIRDSNSPTFSRFDSYEDPSDDSDNVSGNQIDSETSSLADLVDLEMRSESDESLPMYQSTSETESETSDLASHFSDEDHNMQQLAPGNSEYEDFDEIGTEHGDEDDMSSLQSAPSPSFSDVDSEDGSGLSPSPSLASDIDQDYDVRHLHYLLEIMPGRRWVRCDGCGSHSLETWYHCAICEPGSGFDLCFKCLQKGFWCYDQAHPLYKCGQNGGRGVITWSTYLLEQDFRVFDLAEGSPKELFAWKASEQELLHKSPPVIAPHKNLAVWPVGQDSLLFVNYERAQSREHRVRVRSGKAHLLSMDLRFSDCGRYLYVAHAEAEQLFNKKSSTKSDNPPTHALTFVLTTLCIASKPPFIKRPHRVSRISHSLETPKKAYSSVVPYTWTWSSTDVYLCLSSSTLRVYKIPLAQPKGHVADTATITTPNEKVFLPLSAQYRSVQFFPPSSPGTASTVIVGPQNGAKVSLPTRIYLQDRDLGEWVNAQDENHADALKRLTSLSTKGFVAVSLTGVSYPVVIFPQQSIDVIGDPNTDVSHDYFCDGTPCGDLVGDEARIKGARFKCLSCDNIDFCQKCVSDARNQHDATHIMLLLPRPVECHSLTPGKRDSESRRTRIDVAWQLLEAVALSKICTLCSVAWGAFSRMLSPDEWQFLTGDRQIELRRTAMNSLQIEVSYSSPGGKGTQLFTRGPGETAWQYAQHPRFTGIRADFNTTSLIEPHEEIKLRRATRHVANISWDMNQPRLKPNTKEDPSPVVRRVIARPDSQEGFEIARHWLAACIEQHTDCMQGQTRLRPSRLIRLPKKGGSKILVVDGTDISEPYVALSYCWGIDPNPVQTTRGNLQAHREEGLLVDNLPAAIRDAVRVTAALKFEYLWIDRFCIVQDDIKDWIIESTNMCNIYSNAMLTISADRSASAWEGFLDKQACTDDQYASVFKKYFLLVNTRHQRLEGLESLNKGKTQPNHRRAWTMQERLMSPRVLHFTSNELIWECDSIVQCECGRQIERSDRQSYFLKLSQDPGNWHLAVSDYSARALTKQSDRYMAIQGLATRFNNLDMGLKTDAGTYVAGLWFKNLAADLSWLSPPPETWATWLQNNQGHETSTLITHGNTNDAVLQSFHTYLSTQEKMPESRRISDPLLPTWTWASVRGPVDYFYTQPSGKYHSLVDLVNSQIIEPDPQNHLGHAIFGSTLTLRGHVIGSNSTTNMLKVTAFIDGHTSETKTKTGTVWERKALLSYTDHEARITIEFDADDPVAAVRRQSRLGDVNAMCMLLGAYATPFNEIPRIRIQSTPTETFTRTKASLSQASRATVLTKEIVESTEVSKMTERPQSMSKKLFASGVSTHDTQELSKGILPTTATHDTPKPTSTELPGYYSDIDLSVGKLYKELGGKDLQVYEVFYLVLIPSEARPGAWERVGCLQGGLRPEARTVMAELYHKMGRQEEVVLV